MVGGSRRNTRGAGTSRARRNDGDDSPPPYEPSLTRLSYERAYLKTVDSLRIIGDRAIGYLARNRRTEGIRTLCSLRRTRHWNAYNSDILRGYDKALVHEFNIAYSDYTDEGAIPIRGVMVEFNRRSIDNFIRQGEPEIEGDRKYEYKKGDPWPLSRELCATICHREYVYNTRAPPTSLVRRDLNLEARMVMKFLSLPT